jgi:hypothetical protein
MKTRLNFIDKLRKIGKADKSSGENVNIHRLLQSFLLKKWMDMQHERLRVEYERDGKRA